MIFRKYVVLETKYNRPMVKQVKLKKKKKPETSKLKKTLKIIKQIYKGTNIESNYMLTDWKAQIKECISRKTVKTQEDREERGRIAIKELKG